MRTGAQRAAGWCEAAEGNHGNSPRSSCPKLREESRRRRCPPLKGEDIRILDGSRIPECMKLFINKSGTAKEVIFRLLQTICRDGRFFYFTGKSFIMAFRKTGGKIYDECEEISETVLYAAC